MIYKKKKLLFGLAVLLLMGVVLWFTGCGGPEGDPGYRGYILLATTTSTYDSGLLDALIPVFTAETGIEVRVLSRGTGQALELGQRGDADVLLVHDRASELKLVAEGFFTDRYDVMYNDFVVVGPLEDPAGIAGMQSAVEALAAIAEGGYSFISRGDDSGTHRLEIRLWGQAGVTPEGAWYFAVGQGMGDTLRVANEKKAYTIVDRATYLSLKDKLDLKIVIQGDPLLFNQYGVMAVNPEKHPHVQYRQALQFIEFITSVKGRELTDAFKIGGETLFFPGLGVTELQFPGSGNNFETTATPSLLEGIMDAFKLIFTLDPYLMKIVLLSLRVSGAAIFISMALGVPLGAFLGLQRERKTRFVSKLLYTLMGLPPVVAGLFIYLLLSRGGPLGVLGLLYTPTAMIIAQVTLALPIVTGLTMVGIKSGGRAVEETARTMGAGPLLRFWTVIRESRPAIFGAIVSGFGRVVAEVGAVMIVGGNIEGHTRVMTTAIVLESGKGNFELAIGLGLVLLSLSFLINSLLYRFQGGGSRHE